MSFIEQSIYIHSISYQCGEWLPIEEIQDAQSSQEAIEQLSSLGIIRYSKLTTSLQALIIDEVDKTLAMSELSPDEIDASIFFSTTLDPYVQHSDIPIALDKLGINNAIPYGVFYNQCTNHTQAIQLAQMLCASGRAKNILVFGYDALDDNKISRILPNRTSLYSDAFVSCIVSDKVKENAYRVDSINHLYSPEIASFQKPEEALHFITSYSKSFNQACYEALEKSNKTPDDFSYLITPNYNFSVIRNLAELSGFKEDKVFKEHVSRFSHCFSADHLITLKQFDRNERSQPGDKYFLTAVGGFVVFSTMTLTRV
ncbi:MAG: hypothetical protein OXE99_09550 [Cellvibrionales bacterium]|nr:hypothetical protein [Cellvibrionales bacterium]